MNRLVDLAFATGWAAIKRLPEPAAYSAFDAIGGQVWRRRGRGVTQLERNLRRVVGFGGSDLELRELSRRAMASYSRYWCDVFRLPVWSAERVVASVQTENEKSFRAELEAGRGIVVALPHSANWDLAGAWACVTGAPLATVAERLRPESLYDRFVAYRESLGMEVLPADGGRSIFTTLQERLRAGRLVCLVADRDLSANGVEVDFFGEPARMPPGPAALAISTGACLMPAVLSYQRTGLRVRFQDQIPVPTEGTNRTKIATMTQQLADCYAEGIAAHPEDWHMLQRFWPADVGGAGQPSSGDDALLDARQPADAPAPASGEIPVSPAAPGAPGGRTEADG